MKSKQIEKLRFEPKRKILGSRFTKTEVDKIRKFCQENSIKQTEIFRQAMKNLIPNL